MVKSQRNDEIAEQVVSTSHTRHQGHDATTKQQQQQTQKQLQHHRGGMQFLPSLLGRSKDAGSGANNNNNNRSSWTSGGVGGGRLLLPFQRQRQQPPPPVESINIAVAPTNGSSSNSNSILKRSSSENQSSKVSSLTDPIEEQQRAQQRLFLQQAMLYSNNAGNPNPPVRDINAAYLGHAATDMSTISGSTLYNGMIEQRLQSNIIESREPPSSQSRGMQVARIVEPSSQQLKTYKANDPEQQIFMDQRFAFADEPASRNEPDKQPKWTSKEFSRNSNYSEAKNNSRVRLFGAPMTSSPRVMELNSGFSIEAPSPMTLEKVLVQDCKEVPVVVSSRHEESETIKNETAEVTKYSTEVEPQGSFANPSNTASGNNSGDGEVLTAGIRKEDPSGSKMTKKMDFNKVKALLDRVHTSNNSTARDNINNATLTDISRQDSKSVAMEHSVTTEVIANGYNAAKRRAALQSSFDMNPRVRSKNDIFSSPIAEADNDEEDDEGDENENDDKTENEIEDHSSTTTSTNEKPSSSSTSKIDGKERPGEVERIGQKLPLKSNYNNETPKSDEPPRPSESEPSRPASTTVQQRKQLEPPADESTKSKEGRRAAVDAPDALESNPSINIAGAIWGLFTNENEAIASSVVQKNATDNNEKTNKSIDRLPLKDSEPESPVSPNMPIVGSRNFQAIPILRGVPADECKALDPDETIRNVVHGIDLGDTTTGERGRRQLDPNDRQLSPETVGVRHMLPTPTGVVKHHHPTRRDPDEMFAASNKPGVKSFERIPVQPGKDLVTPGDKNENPQSMSKMEALLQPIESKLDASSPKKEDANSVLLSRANIVEQKEEFHQAVEQVVGSVLSDCIINDGVVSRLTESPQDAASPEIIDLNDPFGEFNESNSKLKKKNMKLRMNPFETTDDESNRQQMTPARLAKQYKLDELSSDDDSIPVPPSFDQSVSLFRNNGDSRLGPSTRNSRKKKVMSPGSSASRRKQTPPKKRNGSRQKSMSSHSSPLRDALNQNGSAQKAALENKHIDYALTAAVQQEQVSPLVKANSYLKIHSTNGDLLDSAKFPRALPVEIAMSGEDPVSDLDQSFRHFPLKHIDADGSVDVSTLDHARYTSDGDEYAAIRETSLFRPSSSSDELQTNHSKPYGESHQISKAMPVYGRDRDSRSRQRMMNNMNPFKRSDTQILPSVALADSITGEWSLEQRESKDTMDGRIMPLHSSLSPQAQSKARLNTEGDHHLEGPSPLIQSDNGPFVARLVGCSDYGVAVASTPMICAQSGGRALYQLRSGAIIPQRRDSNFDLRPPLPPTQISSYNNGRNARDREPNEENGYQPYSKPPISRGKEMFASALPKGVTAPLKTPLIKNSKKRLEYSIMHSDTLNSLVSATDDLQNVGDRIRVMHEDGSAPRRSDGIEGSHNPTTDFQRNHVEQEGELGKRFHSSPIKNQSYDEDGNCTRVSKDVNNSTKSGNFVDDKFSQQKAKEPQGIEPYTYLHEDVNDLHFHGIVHGSFNLVENQSYFEQDPDHYHVLEETNRRYSSSSSHDKNHQQITSLSGNKANANDAKSFLSDLWVNGFDAFGPNPPSGRLMAHEARDELSELHNRTKGTYTGNKEDVSSTSDKRQAGKEMHPSMQAHDCRSSPKHPIRFATYPRSNASQSSTADYETFKRQLEDRIKTLRPTPRNKEWKDDEKRSLMTVFEESGIDRRERIATSLSPDQPIETQYDPVQATPTPRFAAGESVVAELIDLTKLGSFDGNNDDGVLIFNLSPKDSRKRPTCIDGSDEHRLRTRSPMQKSLISDEPLIVVAGKEVLSVSENRDVQTPNGSSHQKEVLVVSELMTVDDSEDDIVAAVDNFCENFGANWLEPKHRLPQTKLHKEQLVKPDNAAESLLSPMIVVHGEVMQTAVVDGEGMQTFMVDGSAAKNEREDSIVIVQELTRSEDEVDRYSVPDKNSSDNQFSPKNDTFASSSIAASSSYDKIDESTDSEVEGMTSLELTKSDSKHFADADGFTHYDHSYAWSLSESSTLVSQLESKHVLKADSPRSRMDGMSEVDYASSVTKTDEQDVHNSAIAKLVAMLSFPSWKPFASTDTADIFDEQHTRNVYHRSSDVENKHIVSNSTTFLPDNHFKNRESLLFSPGISAHFSDVLSSADSSQFDGLPKFFATSGDFIPPLSNSFAFTSNVGRLGVSSEAQKTRKDTDKFCAKAGVAAQDSSQDHLITVGHEDPMEQKLGSKTDHDCAIYSSSVSLNGSAIVPIAPSRASRHHDDLDAAHRTSQSLSRQSADTGGLLLHETALHAREELRPKSSDKGPDQPMSGGVEERIDETLFAICARTEIFLCGQNEFEIVHNENFGGQRATNENAVASIANNAPKQDRVLASEAINLNASSSVIIPASSEIPSSTNPISDFSSSTRVSSGVSNHRKTNSDVRRKATEYEETNSVVGESNFSSVNELSTLLRKASKELQADNRIGTRSKLSMREGHLTPISDITARIDFLDYIFEGTESFICGSQRLSSRRMAIKERRRTFSRNDTSSQLEHVNEKNCQYADIVPEETNKLAHQRKKDLSPLSIKSESSVSGPDLEEVRRVMELARSDGSSEMGSIDSVVLKEESNNIVSLVEKEILESKIEDINEVLSISFVEDLDTNANDYLPTKSTENSEKQDLDKQSKRFVESKDDLQGISEMNSTNSGFVHIKPIDFSETHDDGLIGYREVLKNEQDDTEKEMIPLIFAQFDLNNLKSVIVKPQARPAPTPETANSRGENSKNDDVTIGANESLSSNKIVYENVLLSNNSRPKSSIMAIRRAPRPEDFISRSFVDIPIQSPQEDFGPTLERGPSKSANIELSITPSAEISEETRAAIPLDTRPTATTADSQPEFILEYNVPGRDKTFQDNSFFEVCDSNGIEVMAKISLTSKDIFRTISSLNAVLEENHSRPTIQPPLSAQNSFEADNTGADDEREQVDASKIGTEAWLKSSDSINEDSNFAVVNKSTILSNKTEVSFEKVPIEKTEISEECVSTLLEMPSCPLQGSVGNDSGEGGVLYANHAGPSSMSSTSRGSSLESKTVGELESTNDSTGKDTDGISAETPIIVEDKSADQQFELIPTNDVYADGFTVLDVKEIISASEILPVEGSVLKSLGQDIPCPIMIRGSSVPDNDTQPINTSVCNAAITEKEELPFSDCSELECAVNVILGQTAGSCPSEPCGVSICIDASKSGLVGKNVTNDIGGCDKPFDCQEALDYGYEILKTGSDLPSHLTLIETDYIIEESNCEKAADSFVGSRGSPTMQGHAAVECGLHAIDTKVETCATEVGQHVVDEITGFEITPETVLNESISTTFDGSIEMDGESNDHLDQKLPGSNHQLNHSFEEQRTKTSGSESFEFEETKLLHSGNPTPVVAGFDFVAGSALPVVPSTSLRRGDLPLCSPIIKGLLVDTVFFGSRSDEILGGKYLNASEFSAQVKAVGYGESNSQVSSKSCVPMIEDGSATGRSMSGNLQLARDHQNFIDDLAPPLSFARMSDSVSIEASLILDEKASHQERKSQKGNLLEGQRCDSIAPPFSVSASSCPSTLISTVSEQQNANVSTQAPDFNDQRNYSFARSFSSKEQSMSSSTEVATLDPDSIIEKHGSYSEQRKSVSSASVISPFMAEPQNLSSYSELTNAKTFGHLDRTNNGKNMEVAPTFSVDTRSLNKSKTSLLSLSRFTSSHFSSPNNTNRKSSTPTESAVVQVDKMSFKTIDYNKDTSDAVSEYALPRGLAQENGSSAFKVSLISGEKASRASVVGIAPSFITDPSKDEISSVSKRSMGGNSRLDLGPTMKDFSLDSIDNDSVLGKSTESDQPIRFRDDQSKKTNDHGTHEAESLAENALGDSRVESPAQAGHNVEEQVDAIKRNEELSTDGHFVTESTYRLPFGDFFCGGTSIDANLITSVDEDLCWVPAKNQPNNGSNKFNAPSHPLPNKCEDETFSPSSLMIKSPEYGDRATSSRKTAVDISHLVSTPKSGNIRRPGSNQNGGCNNMSRSFVELRGTGLNGRNLADSNSTPHSERADHVSDLRYTREDHVERRFTFLSSKSSSESQETEILSKLAMVDLSDTTWDPSTIESRSMRSANNRNECQQNNPSVPKEISVDMTSESFSSEDNLCLGGKEGIPQGAAKNYSKTLTSPSLRKSETTSESDESSSNYSSEKPQIPFEIEIVAGKKEPTSLEKLALTITTALSHVTAASTSLARSKTFSPINSTLSVDMLEALATRSPNQSEESLAEGMNKSDGTTGLGTIQRDRKSTLMNVVSGSGTIDVSVLLTRYDKIVENIAALDEDRKRLRCDDVMNLSPSKSNDQEHVSILADEYLGEEAILLPSQSEEQSTLVERRNNSTKPAGPTSSFSSEFIDLTYALTPTISDEKDGELNLTNPRISSSSDTRNAAIDAQSIGTSGPAVEVRHFQNKDVIVPVGDLPEKKLPDVAEKTVDASNTRLEESETSTCHNASGDEINEQVKPSKLTSIPEQLSHAELKPKSSTSSKNQIKSIDMQPTFETSATMSLSAKAEKVSDPSEINEASISSSALGRVAVIDFLAITQSRPSIDGTEDKILSISEAKSALPVSMATTDLKETTSQSGSSTEYLDSRNGTVNIYHITELEGCNIDFTDDESLPIREYKSELSVSMATTDLKETASQSYVLDYFDSRKVATNNYTKLEGRKTPQDDSQSETGHKLHQAESDMLNPENLMRSGNSTSQHEASPKKADDLFSRYNMIVKQMVVLDENRLKRAQSKQMSHRQSISGEHTERKDSKYRFVGKQSSESRPVPIDGNYLEVIALDSFTDDSLQSDNRRAPRSNTGISKIQGRDCNEVIDLGNVSSSDEPYSQGSGSSRRSRLLRRQIQKARRSALDKKGSASSTSKAALDETNSTKDAKENSVDVALLSDQTVSADNKEYDSSAMSDTIGPLSQKGSRSAREKLEYLSQNTLPSPSSSTQAVALSSSIAPQEERCNDLRAFIEFEDVANMVENAIRGQVSAPSLDSPKSNDSSKDVFTRFNNLLMAKMGFSPSQKEVESQKSTAESALVDSRQIDLVEDKKLHAMAMEAVLFPNIAISSPCLSNVPSSINTFSDSSIDRQAEYEPKMIAETDEKSSESEDTPKISGGFYGVEETSGIEEPQAQHGLLSGKLGRRASWIHLQGRTEGRDSPEMVPLTKIDVAISAPSVTREMAVEVAHSNEYQFSAISETVGRDGDDIYLTLSDTTGTNDAASVARSTCTAMEYSDDEHPPYHGYGNHRQSYSIEGASNFDIGNIMDNIRSVGGDAEDNMSSPRFVISSSYGSSSSYEESEVQMQRIESIMHGLRSAEEELSSPRSGWSAGPLSPRSPTERPNSSSRARVPVAAIISTMNRNIAASSAFGQRGTSDRSPSANAKASNNYR